MNNMNVIIEVYQILVKKRYNRDEPYLVDKLKARVSSFIKNNKPIELIGFWGVGPKNKANWADQDSCKFLSKLNEEIKTIYPPGIEFTFIFSEEHGVHNGIDLKTIKSYTTSIEKLFKKYGFKFIHLNSLWKKYAVTFKKINELHQKKQKKWWINIPNSKILEKLATQRNHKLPAKEAAQKYVIMRTLEREFFDKEFKNSIFHTYSGPAFDSLLPDMPRLYFYSYKKGRSNSPWFVTD